MDNESSYEQFESELRSRVYDALSQVAYDIFIGKGWEDYLDAAGQQEAMDSAYDWFATHFWDEFTEG